MSASPSRPPAFATPALKSQSRLRCCPGGRSLVAASPRHLHCGCERMSCGPVFVHSSKGPPHCAREKIRLWAKNQFPPQVIDNSDVMALLRLDLGRVSTSPRRLPEHSSECLSFPLYAWAPPWLGKPYTGRTNARKRHLTMVLQLFICVSETAKTQLFPVLTEGTKLIQWLR